jgi:pimeloyl-ACP methyl ester carboxylesterase
VSEGWVDVDGGRLWYDRRGDGFPVVLLHPELWDSRIWDDQSEAFARHHDVVRYDRRGAGRSDGPSGAYSDLRDLAALTDQLKLERCALVGCGIGGRLAIDAALALTDVVDAIVAVAPELSGYRWRDPGIDVLTERVDTAMGSGDVRGAVELELAVWAPVTSGDPSTAARVRDIAMENAGPRRLSATLAEVPPPAVERLDQIRAATLVVVGDRDLEEIHAIADLIVNRVPGGMKRVIADADLLVNVHRPERFNRIVLDFLSYRSLGAEMDP